MTDAQDQIDPGAQAELHDDFGGLHRDLPALVGRRSALQWIGGLSLAGVLAACGSESTLAGSATSATADVATNSTATTSAGGEVAVASAGAQIPSETAGPFPADGSTGADVLTEAGIDRTDITSSFGSMSGSVDGVATTLEFTVVDAATGEPMVGAAVYIWHCTPAGQYSVYEIADQNYLRGVQVADVGGRVRFAAVFPGCYPGRWPHVHLEVFESLDSATVGSQATKTSQLALPEATCQVVYTDSRYGNSAQNLSRLSIASDNVFSDGWDEQLATVTPAGDGYTASLLVRV